MGYDITLRGKMAFGELVPCSYILVDHKNKTIKGYVTMPNEISEFLEGLTLDILTELYGLNKQNLENLGKGE